ncbi:rhodanese-like domain-containing protein [Dermabacteraceae bacterium P13101]
MENVKVTDVPAGATLVDVREENEWVAGHAPQARHLPASELLARYGEIDPDETTYLICRSGGRSSQAAQWLAGNGYSVVNVTGGMGAWLEAGLPMVSEIDGAEPTVI